MKTSSYSAPLSDVSDLSRSGTSVHTATTFKSVDEASRASMFSWKTQYFHHTNRSGDSKSNNNVNYLANVVDSTNYY
jgi:hypothetical protein